MVVGAGLPHLPSVLSASVILGRLFRYVALTAWTLPGSSGRLLAPAEREGATWSADALAAMGATSGEARTSCRRTGESGMGSCARLPDHCWRRCRDAS